MLLLNWALNDLINGLWQCGKLGVIGCVRGKCCFILLKLLLLFFDDLLPLGLKLTVRLLS